MLSVAHVVVVLYLRHDLTSPSHQHHTFHCSRHTAQVSTVSTEILDSSCGKRFLNQYKTLYNRAKRPQISPKSCIFLSVLIRVVEAESAILANVFDLQYMYTVVYKMIIVKIQDEEQTRYPSDSDIRITLSDGCSIPPILWGFPENTPASYVHIRSHTGTCFQLV